jgi:hypothetical protein
MDAEKLQKESFTKFCELVNDTVGFSTIEVLYAWFYNTFQIKPETDNAIPKPNKNSKNEISKTK